MAARRDKNISLREWNDVDDDVHYMFNVPSMQIYVTAIEYGSREMQMNGRDFGVKVLGQSWAVTAESLLSQQLKELIAPFKEQVARERAERHAAEQERIALERKRYIADLQKLVQQSQSHKY